MAAISTVLRSRRDVTSARQRRKNVPLKHKPAFERPTLTAAEIEVVGQFNDYAWENPQLNFEQTAPKELGRKTFPKTPNGRKFKAECKIIFDAVREL